MLAVGSITRRGKAAGLSSTACRLLESRTIVRRKIKGIRKDLDRRTVGSAPHTALDSADPGHAETSAVGEFFLGQAPTAPIVFEQ